MPVYKVTTPTGEREFSADLKSEIWRTIERFPDYEVSDHGRVRRSTETKVKRHSVFKGMIKKLRLSQYGYYVVYFSLRNTGRTSALVHILVAETFLGQRPSPKHQVAHNDGIRTHNNPSNLRWATFKENMEDKHRHGTQKTVLTKDQAISIFYSPKSNREMALQYGISVQAVFALRKRKTWKHLKVYPGITVEELSPDDVANLHAAGTKIEVAAAADEKETD